VIADTGARAGIADMRTRADTMAINAAACANRSHMGAGMHAPVADAGARGHHMAGMPAGGDAMLVHARACADIADMGPGADAVLADMGANAYAQNLNIRADGIGRDWGEQGKSENRGCKRFHGCHPGWVHSGNGWEGRKFRLRGGGQ
jgi:hypothetical protein